MSSYEIRSIKECLSQFAHGVRQCHTLDEDKQEYDVSFSVTMVTGSPCLTDFALKTVLPIANKIADSILVGL